MGSLLRKARREHGGQAGGVLNPLTSHPGVCLSKQRLPLGPAHEPAQKAPRSRGVQRHIDPVEAGGRFPQELGPPRGAPR
jgi:hypothetical protein